MTPSVKTEAVTTISNLGIALGGKQDIVMGMIRFSWAVLLLPFSLAAQKLEPCQPETPALKMEEPLQATGLQIGGVEKFPAGIYKPLGRNGDGIFYLYEKPLTARLMAESIQVPGGLFVPSDPEEETRGWYSMPDGAKSPVLAPEQGVDSAWEGDPTLPASNPYQAANLSRLRRFTGLSAKPKLTLIPPAKP